MNKELPQPTHFTMGTSHIGVDSKSAYQRCFDVLESFAYLPNTSCQRLGIALLTSVHLTLADATDCLAAFTVSCV